MCLCRAFFISQDVSSYEIKKGTVRPLHTIPASIPSLIYSLQSKDSPPAAFPRALFRFRSAPLCRAASRRLSRSLLQKLYRTRSPLPRWDSPRLSIECKVQSLYSKYLTFTTLIDRFTSGCTQNAYWL